MNRSWSIASSIEHLALGEPKNAEFRPTLRLAFGSGVAESAGQSDTDNPKGLTGRTCASDQGAVAKRGHDLVEDARPEKVAPGESRSDGDSTRGPK